LVWGLVVYKATKSPASKASVLTAVICEQGVNFPQMLTMCITIGKVSLYQDKKRVVHNPHCYLESLLGISYAQANTSVYLGLSPEKKDSPQPHPQVFPIY
jgi:hypothetical protein